MRGKHRTSLPVAALLVLTAALTAALAETDTDKTELPGGNPATPEVTILNKGILFASVTNPELLVILQLLDGVTTRGIQRHGAARRRRSDARHRPLQSRTRNCRYLHRHRRFGKRHTRRLHQRPFRQSVGVGRPGCDRVRRLGGSVVPDAGNPRRRRARLVPRFRCSHRRITKPAGRR
jgi:hypothetical protein